MSEPAQPLLAPLTCTEVRIQTSDGPAFGGVGFVRAHSGGTYEQHWMLDRVAFAPTAAAGLSYVLPESSGAFGGITTFEQFRAAVDRWWHAHDGDQTLVYLWAVTHNHRLLPADPISFPAMTPSAPEPVPPAFPEPWPNPEVGMQVDDGTVAFTEGPAAADSWAGLVSPTSATRRQEVWFYRPGFKSVSAGAAPVLGSTPTPELLSDFVSFMQEKWSENCLWTATTAWYYSRIPAINLPPLAAPPTRPPTP